LLVSEISFVSAFDFFLMCFGTGCLTFDPPRSQFTLTSHQGPSTIENVGRDKSLFLAFRWRHHVHSTVVWLFVKLLKWGTNYSDIFWGLCPKCLNGYAHGGGAATRTV